jgi:hypothetical protein
MIRNATLALAALALVASTSIASAALRSPQIAVQGGSLQGYLNGVGQTINVLTDQDAAQVWTSTVSGNSTFTLQIELAGNAASNAIGVYNGAAASPTLYQVFPGAAQAGWFAVASFRSGGLLRVNLFDDTATLAGSTSYTGVDRDNFGFYLAGPGGTFYTQDYRNPGGSVQALTYGATGTSVGSWWLCWEDVSTDPGVIVKTGSSDSDYDDAVLFLESVNPTPATTESWGSLKRRYR